VSLKNSSLRRTLASVLTALLAQGLLAQPQAGAPALPPQSLRVLILEGADAVNSIPNRVASFPVVEVRDENDLPVEGADVTFELPGSGPGGVFPGGKTVFSGRTNLQGQIRAPYIMNAEPGEFVIKVTAKMGERTGGVMVRQEHSLKTPEEMAVKKKRWYKSWKIWAVLSGAAAAAIILGTRGGDSADNTIIITPGGPSIGGPR
jgi:hypothetical protein